MSDLIKREDVLKQIWEWVTDREFNYTNATHWLQKRIEAIPTIDAVEVVRCKECIWLRYCETEDLDLYLDCDKSDGGGIPRSEDWFCADGEREGE